MSNLIYPTIKSKFLEGEIDMLDDTIKVILIDTDNYTYAETDEFLSIIPSSAIIAISDALTGKTVTNGIFLADNITLALVTGNTSEALVLYKDTGDSATSPLITYIDQASEDLPITPNGNDIDISWPATGIFCL